MLVQPGLSVEERMSLNVKWSSLRRLAPDTGAKDALPHWKWNIVHYLAYIPYSAFAVVYVPYLTLKHVTRTDRWEEWGYGRMIRNRLNKLWEGLLAGRLNAMDTDPFARPKSTKGIYEEAEARGDLKIEEVMIPPVQEEMRMGVVVNEHVEAVDVAAYWVTPKGSAQSGGVEAGQGEKVILHIHGGRVHVGYICGHPLWNTLILEVTKASRVRALSVNYRKPLLAHTAFPGPLLDVLAAYIHLLQLGFLPQNITFLGKSAGGNLALVLLRYLNDIRLPLPGKVGMMAPWCDLTMSFPSYTRHKDFDGLSRAKLLTSVRSAMRWYTPEGREYFSPALVGKGEWEWLQGTEVYMQVGTRELFEDEVNKTAEDMRAAGVQVRVREDPNGLHTSALQFPHAMEVFVKDMVELIDP